MILVTGGTGFIGKALIRRLVELGFPVRTLIRPSSTSPDLPRGVPVQAAVSSLADPRGLRAAMVGVHTVFHLAGGEWRGPQADLLEIDIQGTQAMVQAAQDANIRRIFFISHLGADRASAYPVIKAKGIAEEFIRRSGIDYTILRTALVFGPSDHFTTGIARILRLTPLVYLTPGDGQVQLQPLWVQDLVTCLVWSMEDAATRNDTFEIGGPEYLSFNQVVRLVMEKTRQFRWPIHIYPPYLRGLTIFLEAFSPNLPVSVYWLDYLAVSRTTSLDTLPRQFNLLPARLSSQLDYLQGREWHKTATRRRAAHPE